jgi:hypothetical protein
MSRLPPPLTGRPGQVNPYPTRNFATLGILVTPRCEHRGARTFRFRLALHVAMEIGPYLRSGQERPAYGL